MVLLFILFLFISVHSLPVNKRKGMCLPCHKHYHHHNDKSRPKQTELYLHSDFLSCLKPQMGKQIVYFLLYVLLYLPCLCLALSPRQPSKQSAQIHILAGVWFSVACVTPLFLAVITLHWWVSSWRMDFLQDAGPCCSLSMQKDIWVSYSGCAGIHRLERSQLCGCRAAQTLSNLCSVALSSEGL